METEKNDNAQAELENALSVAAIGHPADTTSDGYRSQPWYAEYMAALFETDRAKLRHRIPQAKSLIVSREREIRYTRAHHLEQRALNNALHALEALRACLGL